MLWSSFEVALSASVSQNIWQFSRVVVTVQLGCIKICSAASSLPRWSWGSFFLEYGHPSQPRVIVYVGSWQVWNIVCTLLMYLVYGPRGQLFIHFYPSRQLVDRTATSSFSPVSHCPASGWWPSCGSCFSLLFPQSFISDDLYLSQWLLGPLRLVSKPFSVVVFLT